MTNPDTYAVHFDWRDDTGPTLVGPFPSKLDAEAWLSTQTGFDYEAECWPMQTP